MKLSRIDAFAAVVLVCALASCTAESPRSGISPQHIVSVVSAVGLVEPAAFLDSIRSDEVAAELSAQMRQMNGQPFPARAPDVLQANHPFSCARHATGFEVCEYHSERGVELLWVFAPVVNGSESETELMLESLRVAVAAVSDDTGLREWADSAWQASWAAYGREDAQRDDVVHEREAGPYSLAVWGVPPDFIQAFAVLKR